MPANDHETRKYLASSQRPDLSVSAMCYDLDTFSAAFMIPNISYMIFLVSDVSKVIVVIRLIAMLILMSSNWMRPLRRKQATINTFINHD
jgi:hypothetical protein